MTGSKLSDKIKIAMIPEDRADEIYPMACYYFDGSGKSIRPLIVGRIAEALGGCIETNQKLQKVAMIAEMIHTGSLVHDDVIDKSEERSVINYKLDSSVFQAWKSLRKLKMGSYEGRHGWKLHYFVLFSASRITRIRRSHKNNIQNHRRFNIWRTLPARICQF